MAQTMAYTPGPWATAAHIQHEHGQDYIEVRRMTAGPADEWPLVALATHERTETEKLANARLIAAAPALLEALASLLAKLESGTEVSPEMGAQARAAVEAAQGRD